MYVIRRFRHAIEKGTSTGEAVRIVADTLMEAQHGEVVFHAYFSDFKHRKVSKRITQASLALRGATWAHSTALWAHPKSKKLRIRSPQTARRYAENIAAAVAHAITLWAEPIEALYGSSDEWLPQSRS